MKHKIAFFDMDGTLYQTENDVISASTLAAIDNLRQAGYLIAAATGRPLNQMKLILERVQFDYYILMNGGYILDSQFRIVDTSPMAEEDVNALVGLAEDESLGLLLHFGDTSYIYNDFYPMYYFSKYTNALDSLFYDPNKAFHQRHPVYNSLILTKNPDTVSNFVAAHPNLQMDLINVKTDGFAYDIYNSSADKSLGAQKVLDVLNLDWKDAVAFGDSENDLSLLQKADIGVAMGQASQEVKNAADFVTDEIARHGIYNAVKRILALDIL